MRRPLRTCLTLLLAALALAACGRRRTPVENLTYLSTRAMANYEFREAQALLEEALRWDPDDFDALIALAKASAAVGEHPRALALYDRAAAVAPRRPEPARGKGSLAILLNRKEEARRWFLRALLLAPEDPMALAGAARVEIEKENYWEADHLLTWAEEETANSTYVLSSRSEYWFRTGDMDRSVALLRRAIEISPTYISAHKRLANGFLELHREPYRPPEVPADYARAVEAAANLYRERDFGGAETAFAALDEDDAPDGRPPFFRGLVALRSGRVRESIPHLWRALEREPDNYLFRNALATAYMVKLARQRAEYGGGHDGKDRLAPIAGEMREEEIPGVERIVRGYERLLPRERQVVLRAVRPLASYLPALEEQGVRHDILGFEDGICDASERAWLSSRRTHDGRWYGALRGVGGKHAATGVEAILEAAELRYDTFAHELAHQVHLYGLSDKDRAEVERLYAAAVEEDRCLDYYAATNEREYLAQGYEAFVNLVKSPYHHGQRRHTRAELLARDPKLYAFIMRITGTPTRDPELARLGPRIVDFYEWAGDRISLERVRKLLAAEPAPAESPDDR